LIKDRSLLYKPIKKSANKKQTVETITKQIIISNLESKQIVKSLIVKSNFNAINNSNNLICCADYQQSNLTNSRNEDTEGFQCTAICVYALAYSLIQTIDSWDSITLNKILNCGDEYYNICLSNLIENNMFQNNNLMTEEVLGLIKINNQEIFIDIVKSNESLLLNNLFTIKNLEDGFEYFKNNFIYGTFTINMFTYAIFYLNSTYYFFNSHATSNEGLTQGDGKASIIKFDSANSIKEIIHLLVKLHSLNKQVQFTLEPISIQLLDKNFLKRDSTTNSNLNILPSTKKIQISQNCAQISQRSIISVPKMSRDLSDLSISAGQPFSKKKCSNISNINCVFENLYSRIQAETMNNFVKLKAIIYEDMNNIIKFINLIRNIKNNFIRIEQSIDNLYDDIIRINNIENILIAVHTIGDGNCGYRALSNVLFGHQNNYKAIRICICFILIEYREYFSLIFITQNESINCIEKYVLKHSRDTEWANDFIMQAAAILINRPVISFFSSLTRKPHLMFNNNKSLKNPVCIIYSHNHGCGGHYTSLLDKRENVNQMDHWISNSDSIYPYITVFIYNGSVIYKKLSIH